MAEPARHALVVGVALRDADVIDAVFVQQPLVAFQERRACQPATVPEHGDQAARRQDAREFVAHPFLVEPVERLRGDDEVDRAVGQARGLGGAIHGAEAVFATEPALGGRAHRRVRFDGGHAMSGVEEQLARYARARADVGDGPVGADAEAMQPLDQRRGIVRAIADVVLDAIGKTFRGAKVGHGLIRSGQNSNLMPWASGSASE